MCGIVGHLELQQSASTSWPLEVCAREMVARLTHRGPGDAGTWHDLTARIALGHRRLSVLDLSHDGHQPMRSSTGRLVMVFNGKIYNHRELRSELKARGHAFGGTSDAEVALAAILERGIDFGALASFFLYGYVPDPQCIYRGIEALLRNSVRLRMGVDLPVSAILSGGIDSSVVVALMQAQSVRLVRTFTTIEFFEDQYNEAPYAAAVARHLGTDHTELYLSADEAMEVIPNIPETWDEPFADSSQIPTFLVSKLAAGEVTVALSGDGGDELYGGYTRYPLVANEWRLSRRLPRLLRRRLGSAVDWANTGLGGTSMWPLMPLFLLAGKSTVNLGGRLQWRAHAWEQETVRAFYDHHAAYAPNPWVRTWLGYRPSSSVADVPVDGDETTNEIEQMMLMDLHRYLPDDILTKVDRASMAVSLEARVPLLDHRLVEFAWGLPFDLRVGDSGGKKLLRRVVERHVLFGLLDRPKMGFRHTVRRVDPRVPSGVGGRAAGAPAARGE